MRALDFPRPFASYVLLERLGAGGMSEVDLARRAGDDATGRFVVIKRIRTGSTDERAVRMFRDEARINGQLIHENIATVYDSGRVGDEWFLVMEFVPGMDLRGLQLALAHAGRPFPTRVALTILCQVLRALQFAHTREDELGRPMLIVHRDVNPRNVMLSTRGAVKLIDFGVARAAERLERTETNAVKGKFAYMAPEQIEGSADIDGRVDLYAIGLMLHELLTGKSPFTGLTEVQILHRVLSGRLPGLPDDLDIPSLPLLREIHARALALRPEDRFEDADAFRLALESALVPLGGSAPQRMVAALLEEATGDKMREITERLRYWHEGSTAEVSFGSAPGASSEGGRGTPAGQGAGPVAGEYDPLTVVTAPPADRSASGIQGGPSGGAAHAVTRGTLTPTPLPRMDDATVVGGVSGLTGAVSVAGPVPHTRVPAHPDAGSNSGTFASAFPSENTLADGRLALDVPALLREQANGPELPKPRNLLPWVGGFLGIAIVAASFVAWQVIRAPAAPPQPVANVSPPSSPTQRATPSAPSARAPATAVAASVPASSRTQQGSAVSPRSSSPAASGSASPARGPATQPVPAAVSASAASAALPPPPDPVPGLVPTPVVATEPTPAASTTSGANGRLSVVAGGGKAQVYVDGKLVGTTPVRLLSLSVGAHEVRLVNPDTKAETTRIVTITADTLLPLMVPAP